MYLNGWFHYLKHEYTVYYGTLVHSISIEQLDAIQNGVLIIDNQGAIVHLERDVADLQAFLDKQAYKNVEVSCVC
ncbi:hypothetical protein FB192DRAFT_1385899 [Mucor lusitanicus]|uniref:Uncharacterized protein n=1 Tax=Mucor circinelloides f. lusitanicus TaxID=29924 RepID=A0A8H4BC78_MUCCL|nr:hypothetical protein FB192DRAFT_1385899 [Mucor lusitanicus]